MKEVIIEYPYLCIITDKERKDLEDFGFIKKGNKYCILSRKIEDKGFFIETIGKDEAIKMLEKWLKERKEKEIYIVSLPEDVNIYTPYLTVESGYVRIYNPEGIIESGGMWEKFVQPPNQLEVIIPFSQIKDVTKVKTEFLFDYLKEE